MGDMGNSRQQIPGRVHHGQRFRDVQGREVCHLGQAGTDSVVQQSVAAQLRSPVDDTVCGSCRRRSLLQQLPQRLAFAPLPGGDTLWCSLRT